MGRNINIHRIKILGTYMARYALGYPFMYMLECYCIRSISTSNNEEAGWVGLIGSDEVFFV